MAVVKYLLGLTLCAASFSPIVRGQQAKRPVTVADAIRMTRLGGSTDDLPARFSPDGQKFAVVVRSGNLEQNTNDYSLLLWRTSQVFNGAKPEVLTTLSSSSNRAAIQDVRWRDDSETILFLGEHPGELQQIYSLNIRTHTLEKLTDSPTNIVSYTTSAHGEKVLYAAEPGWTTLFEGKSRREGFVVSTQTIYEIVAGQRDLTPTAVIKGDVQFFLQNGQLPPVKVSTKLLSPVKFHPPVMSPDGSYVVLIAIVDSIPAGWNDYLDPNIQHWTQHKRTPLASGQRATLFQTVLLDTSTGELRPLLNAPTSTSSEIEVAWSPDSHSVVITNTFLPLTTDDASERSVRLRTAFAAVEVKLPERAIAKITNQHVNSPAWLSADRLSFRKGPESEGRIARISFEKRGSQWIEVGNESAECTPLDIIQEEDLNEPPKIVAFDPKTGRRALLLDLNPQFAALQFAKEEAIEWRGSDGHEVKGGLYYPVEYVRGRRYPLVIQTHGFKPTEFWIDGPFSTAFAAQPIAGQGIMVLQMDEDYGESDIPREVDREVASLEGAIDFLDQRGLIDRSRVGVIGFSRTCLHVKFALTNSKYHFAAASTTDGVDNGYFQYLLLSGIQGLEEAFEGSNGGLPFGKGLQAWMRRAPGFHVDQVSTPLLIFAPNLLSALFQWEWYAGLKRLDKPVEMVVLEDGEHQLQRPWDRRASLQRNVDWFRFWLKAEEESDPDQGEQYTRWRGLRKLQAPQN